MLFPDEITELLQQAVEISVVHDNAIRPRYSWTARKMALCSKHQQDQATQKPCRTNTTSQSPPARQKMHSLGVASPLFDRWESCPSRGGPGEGHCSSSRNSRMTAAHKQMTIQSPPKKPSRRQPRLGATKEGDNYKSGLAVVCLADVESSCNPPNTEH